MRKSKILISMLACAAVAGCSKDDNNEQSALKDSTLSNDAFGYSFLGQAYDTRRVKTLNVTCATGNIKESLVSDSNFVLDYDLSYQDFLDKTQGKLTADLNLPAVRAGLGAQYAKENAATSSSTTFVFNWQMTKKRVAFDENTYRVSDKGQQFINGDKSQLQERCGDEFITNVDYGASFFVTMKVDFLNDSDKTDIGGKLKLAVGKENIDLVKIEGELNKIDQKKKESVKLSIRARQVGGDPVQLTSFLSDNVVECTLANPKPCFDVYNQAIRYARTSVPTQLAGDAAFVPVRFLTKNYKESGLDELVPSGGYQFIDALTKAKRREIEAQYQQNLVDYQRAADILRKYSDYLEEAQIEVISNIKDITFNNAAILGDVSLTCFDAPSSCISYSKSAEPGIKPYDRSKLALRSSMSDLKDVNLGSWSFGHPKDASAFARKVVGGNNTLEDRQGIALKSDTGEMIRVATYVSEYDCVKAANIIGSSSPLSIVTSRDYGISFRNDDFGGEYTFTMEAAFRNQAAGKCLFVSMYPVEPHRQRVDLGVPSEFRTFVRRVLESVK
ncbi:MAG TPA: hypothetical protein VFO10_18455 [Oligoflexus sp.]|uniref:hypothetical protein n=1 Tax=Oligoflexus sp. TaxID=1971216 RepID=UPI002D804609|nr:hypothetical protein [Oligoflexus sp.]HET9239248.1 hypothetical protein [Oligoflexus sp.]